MDYKLLFTLLNPRRTPRYLTSIIYAYFNNLLMLKKKFNGMLSLPEGCTLHSLARRLPKKAVVVEIGCYGGLSSAFILAGLKKKGWLYSIDPFEKNIEQQLHSVTRYADKNYKDEEYRLIAQKPSKEKVIQLLRKGGFRNFTLIEGYSFDVVKNWHNKIDMLWIDGNHDYKAVLKDFNDWSRFLKNGGVIAFHDANKQGHSKNWTWGWKGPTMVAKQNLKKPVWTKISRVDSLVYATKNF